MEQYYGLILTLIAGLFFLIGGLISLKIKNKEKLHIFSIALAFIIIINLLVMDLIPEILELLESYDLSFKILIIAIFGILGQTGELKTALKNGPANITRTTENIVRTLKIQLK